MATYYVSNSGNNGNPGSFASPWLTIAHAVAQLSSGDTLFVRGNAGTYTGSNNRVNSTDFTVPNNITIKGYPGDAIPIIQPPSDVSPVHLTTGAPSGITFEDLILDGINSATAGGAVSGLIYASSGANNITFRRVEVKRGFQNGIQLSHNNGACHHFSFIDCSLHDFGDSVTVNAAYAAYVSTNDNLFNGCEIYNCAGYGLHFYDFPGVGGIHRNIVRNCIIRDNGRNGGSNYGVVIAEGEDNAVYNNLIYRNRGGLQIWRGSVRAVLYNNTIYNNVNEGIAAAYYSSSQPPQIKNNIVYANGQAIVDHGTNGDGTVQLCVQSNNLTTNPLFNNVSADDFTLTTGSPAKDAGTTLALFADDYNGNLRPQGPAFDIGAHEFTVAAGGGPGTWALIHTTAANVTSYTDTGRSPNTRYHYRVRATNASGNSGYTNEANALTTAGDTTAALNSEAVTGAVGTVTPLVGVAVAVTSVAGTGAVGTVTPLLEGIQVALTGVPAIGSVGSVSIEGAVSGVTVPLTVMTLEYFAVGSWRDLTADLVSTEGVMLRYGIDGNGPTDVVASPGELTFSLRNDAGNSGSQVGYYSPRHGNVRTGWTFGVPVRFTLGATGIPSVVKFYGKAWEITPVPGQNRAPKLVRVVAQDTITDLLDADVRAVTLQVNKTETELLTAILDSLPASVQPLARSLDVGVDQIPFAFDEIGDGAKALPLIRDVVQSSYGLYFQRGTGTHVYKNRHARATTLPSTVLADAQMQEFAAPSSVDRCFNIVRTVTHPRVVSSVATEELYALVVDQIYRRSLTGLPLPPQPNADGQVAIALAPGETKQVWCEYTDPLNREDHVGATSVTIAALAIRSGPNGGSDLGFGVTTTLTAFASTALVSFTNNLTTNAYVNTLILHGKTVRDPGPQTFEVSSVQPYSHQVTVDLPYQNDSTFALGLSNLILNQYGTLTNQVDSVTFLANGSGALMSAALGREPGDVVTLTEQITGVALLDVEIHQVDLRISQGKWVMCSWLVAPRLSLTAPWVLDVGALDSTTVLGL